MISDKYIWGILGVNDAEINIQNNLIENFKSVGGSSSSTYGILLEGCVLREITIDSNNINNIGGAGIRIELGDWEYNNLQNIKITNNLIYNNTQGINTIDVNILIRFNVIFQNEVGIYLEGRGSYS